MSSAAAVLARIAAQVHIDPRPSPKNLHESRQILHALQKFGEVVVFRNMKYDITNKKPNEDERPILAILDSVEAAHRAIAASPITVTIPNPSNPAPTSSVFSQTPIQTSSSDTDTDTDTDTNTNTNTNMDTEPLKIICAIESSRHNHDRTLTRNPFHTTYEIDKDTPIYADMTSAETAVPLKGLADVLQRPKKPMPAWLKAQTQKSTARMGGHSLMELWREGLMNAEIEKIERAREDERNAKTELRRLSLRRMREEGGVELEDGSAGDEIERRRREILLTPEK